MMQIHVKLKIIICIMLFYHGFFHTGIVWNVTNTDLSLMANNILLPFEGL